MKKDLPLPDPGQKHRVQLDLGPKALARLNEFKAALEAGGYGEVVRYLLQNCELPKA